MSLLKKYMQILNEDQTLDDLKDISYEKGSPKDIITDFLANKINMLDIREVPGKGQKEIKFFANAIKQNPSITIPNINATSVYISGPMTKHPYVNYHSFYLAEAILNLGGITSDRIINPATIKHNPKSGWVDFMIEDIEGMFLRTDMLMLLPGWESSLGAKVEKAVAENVKNFKKIFNSEIVEYDAKGDVDQITVSGNSKELFYSTDFQNILKRISLLTNVSFDYIAEIFKTQKVFDSIKKASNSYQIQELNKLIDLNTCEKAIADQIQSLNLWKEDLFINYMNKIGLK